MEKLIKEKNPQLIICTHTWITGEKPLILRRNSKGITLRKTSELAESSIRYLSSTLSKKSISFFIEQLLTENFQSLGDLREKFFTSVFRLQGKGKGINLVPMPSVKLVVRTPPTGNRHLKKTGVCLPVSMLFIPLICITHRYDTYNYKD